ncbi:MAG: amidohydrolase [Oscillospiraceae bacterium]|nr:amidohydrolase [Oscillospiraceae bacterium]
MLTTDRRALHRIPELDRRLPETAAYLRSALEPLPCRVFSPWEDAVCAYFDFHREATIAFRSDMDALPVTELTGLPHASVHPGCMHACGHDGHMAILLGLARHLAESPASSNVLLIFQPAEETTGGAKAICDTGLLEQYGVRRIYGLHLWPGSPKGQVASCPGGMMARSCELHCEIQGRSVHLARWQEGQDALLAAVRLVDRAYTLAEGKPCLLRFGTLNSGTAQNALSDHSRLAGSLRCYDDALFLSLWEGLQRIAAQVEQETGCTVTLTRTEGYPPVTNDPAALEEAKARYPIAPAAPSFTAEDFSEYQRHVPGVFFWLGTGDGPALHSPHFDFDESVLETGLALFRALL